MEKQIHPTDAPPDVFDLAGLPDSAKKKLAYLDADGDGKIDNNELSRHVEDHARDKEMKILFKNLVYALVILCFVLLGCLTAMTVIVVQKSRTSKVDDSEDSPVLRSMSGKPVSTSIPIVHGNMNDSHFPSEEEHDSLSPAQVHYRKLLSPGFNESLWLPVGTIPRSVALDICEKLADGIPHSNIFLPKIIVDPVTNEELSFFKIHNIVVSQFTGCGSNNQEIVGMVVVDGVKNVEVLCRGGNNFCHVFADPATNVIVPDLEYVPREGNVTILNDTSAGLSEHERRLFSQQTVCASIDYGWVYSGGRWTRDVKSYCFTFFTSTAYIEYNGNPVCGASRYPFQGNYYKWCVFPGMDALMHIGRKAGVPSFVFDTIDFAFRMSGKGSANGLMCSSFYNFYPSTVIVKDCNCKSGCSCFPSKATVEVENKGTVKMNELAYGDRVKTLKDDGEVGFEEVYLFGHKLDGEEFDYINIALENRKVLTLTAKHFATVCVNDCTRSGLLMKTYAVLDKYAHSVKPGDIMVLVDSDNTVYFSAVTQISTSREVGVYNPYVRGGGHIIVDGIVASVHSEWILDRFSVIPKELLPAVYDIVLSPVYLLYRVIGPRWSDWLAARLGVHDAREADASPLFFVYAATLSFPAALLYFSVAGGSKRTILTK